MVKRLSTWQPEEDAMLKELYENNMASEQIAQALGRTVESVDNRRRKTGLKRNFVLEKVPPPDDFVGMLNTMNVSQLMKHYGHARSVICRWIFELELTTIVRGGRKKVIPSNFDTVAPTMTCAELTRLYNANRATIVGWLRERGITPLSIWDRRELNANPVPAKTEEDTPATRRELSGRTKLVAVEAAKFLRRYHPSVHRADIKMFEHSSHTWGDVNNVPFRGVNQYYVAGKGIMWSDDLIAYAESRGFKIKELT
jgi:hypothetical protein